MPLGFLQRLLLSYMEKGEKGRYLRNNTKNTEAHTTQSAACGAEESLCSFLPASIRMRHLRSTPALLLPRNAELGLSRPGGRGDSPTLAPLLCSEARAQGGRLGWVYSWTLPKVFVFYLDRLQVSNPQATDDTQLPSRLYHQRVPENMTEV